MRTSTDGRAKDPQVVATDNLSRLIGTEAVTQHRRHELHPLCVILYAAGGNLLVCTDADVFDADDIDHLFEPFDIPVAVWEVPDPDSTARLRNRSRVISADLSAS
jgi:hypothetical protein